MDMSEKTTDEYLLQAVGISKRFGATQALDNVDFDLRPSEVHALMGENGAGKSTLMKIFSGDYAPDSGEIVVRGNRVVMASPRDAMTHGIGIIHQELNTLPEMTVAENLAIGQEPVNSFGMLDRRRMIEAAQQKLAAVGADLDPRMPIGRLSVGMQQMVEIARAIAEDVNILVLDEPTAALSVTESRRLFELIRGMKAKGMGLIYISHRMEEVWELADRVTVFRDGKLVGTRDMRAVGDEEVKPRDIVRMMVGRDVDDLYGDQKGSIGEPRVVVRELQGNAVGPVSFDVRAGEIVSFVGLIGAGRTEVARMLYGADPSIGGSVSLDGKEVNLQSPAAAMAQGIGLLPESRKEQALFQEMSVSDNTVISTLKKFCTAGVLDSGKIKQSVKNTFSALQVRAASPAAEARSLSGGNQQKLVFARLVEQAPAMLILDEPTRGVDIGAKSEIYRIIRSIADSGTAVMVVSSDLPEALGISDRLMVMRGGRIVAELLGVDATEEKVMEHATGVYSNEAEGREK